MFTIIIIISVTGAYAKPSRHLTTTTTTTWNWVKKNKYSINNSSCLLGSTEKKKTKVSVFIRVSTTAYLIGVREMA